MREKESLAEYLQGFFIRHTREDRHMPMRFPRLEGKVSIKDEEGKIVIAGDPDGLRSLGRLLAWLGDADQEQWPYLMPGGHAHIHLYPREDMSEESSEVELVRMDAKGAGESAP